jgi:hypothetical protein
VLDAAYGGVQERLAGRPAPSHHSYTDVQRSLGKPVSRNKT